MQQSENDLNCLRVFNSSKAIGTHICMNRLWARYWFTGQKKKNAFFENGRTQKKGGQPNATTTKKKEKQLYKPYPIDQKNATWTFRLVNKSNDFIQRLAVWIVEKSHTLPLFVAERKWFFNFFFRKKNQQTTIHTYSGTKFLIGLTIFSILLDKICNENDVWQLYFDKSEKNFFFVVTERKMCYQRTDFFFAIIEPYNSLVKMPLPSINFFFKYSYFMWIFAKGISTCLYRD